MINVSENYILKKLFNKYICLIYMDDFKLKNLKNLIEDKNYKSLWFSLENGNLKKVKKSKINSELNLINVKTNIIDTKTPVKIKVEFYNQIGGVLKKDLKKCKNLNYTNDDLVSSNYKLSFSKINNFCKLINNNLLKKSEYNINKIKSMNFVPISEFSLKGGNIYNIFEGGSEERDDILTSVNNGVQPGKSKLSGAGSGVFATRDFKVNDVIEIVPVLAIPIRHTTENILKDYVFMFDGENYGMALGYGSMYNHQNSPNVVYSYSKDKKFMKYTASKDIKKGDELFVSYGLGWWLHRNITPVDIMQ